MMNEIHLIGPDKKTADINQKDTHGVLVIGKTKDGKLIVSSYGKKYYLDLDYYKKKGSPLSFEVVEYGK